MGTKRFKIHKIWLIVLLDIFDASLWLFEMSACNQWAVWKFMLRMGHLLRMGHGVIQVSNNSAWKVVNLFIDLNDDQGPLLNRIKLKYHISQIVSCKTSRCVWDNEPRQIMFKMFSGHWIFQNRKTTPFVIYFGAQGYSQQKETNSCHFSWVELF